MLAWQGLSWQTKSRLNPFRSRPIASAKGSPEICISTDAMKWSRVTKVVSTAETSSCRVWGRGRPESTDAEDPLDELPLLHAATAQAAATPAPARQKQFMGPC